MLLYSRYPIFRRSR